MTPRESFATAFFQITGDSPCIACVPVGCGAGIDPCQLGPAPADHTPAGRPRPLPALAPAGPGQAGHRRPPLPSASAGFCVLRESATSVDGVARGEE